MPRHSFISFLTLAVYFISATARESAWNGQTTPGSTSPSPFRPYYVPPGAKSYDSSSPLVLYSGKWIESSSNEYAFGTLRSTDSVNASVSFSFTGTGVEWFGETNAEHGFSNVFIDGKFVQRVDGWSNATFHQQRLFWDYQLSYGKHTLKIVNTGSTTVDVDAFVVTRGASLTSSSITQDNLSTSVDFISFDTLPASPQWTLVQNGSTGVSAMQLAIISPTHALIIDKVEHNPVDISGHPAWAALFDLDTYAVIPLAMQSNSFCAGGSFLSNGTLINIGGNPVVEDYTSAADFGDVDGLQAIRIFEPCNSASANGCTIFESHDRIRLASPRWYNTVVRISDGSAMIIGGSLKGGWINNATVNNPTLEYWPPKSIHNSNGLPIHLQLLADTLNSNLFPIAFALPDNTIFIAANNDATIYDWQSNTERRLPSFPNGVRVTYPMAGTGTLLPLSPASNYTPEVLICGGSNVSDTLAGYDISSQAPASAQCARMVLNDAGIAGGWQVEEMPEARLMPDAVLLPTGDVIIVNGAGSGISGYGNVKDQVGTSNAANPVLTPVLYSPTASPGSRFSSAGLPSSAIPRLYHSTASLTPQGNIMIAGSNPNLDRSEIEYGTEYRVEWLGPPYMTAERPSLDGVPTKVGFGATVDVRVSLPASMGESADIKVALMDLGFITHAVHANSRFVYLVSSRSTFPIDASESDSRTVMLSITGPPNVNIYPPGPGWLYVVVDGVPSVGAKVLVGTGEGPEVDQIALQNMLAKTSPDQYDVDKDDSSE